MSDLFHGPEHSTPLTVEEQEQLVPSLSTRQELNEFERQNILQASAWLFAPRRRAQLLQLTEPALRQLHRRMFHRTWRWAGQYRATARTIGIPHYLIREFVPSLLGDLHHWTKNHIYSEDEIALRFHHRLVQIHPFPNGNGRHARLLADALIVSLGQPVFTWGSAEISAPGDARKQYIAALRSADRHDHSPLLHFARS